MPITPWILPPDSFRVDVTAEIEASTAKLAKPLSLAPDIWLGATDDLTLGFTESKYATTGFRGAAGGGLCLTGTNGGCPAIYNNVGFEAWYGAAQEPAGVALGGGPYAVNIDRGFYDLKLGLKLRIPAGTLAITTMPSLFLAMSGRDERVNPNKDTLYVPVAFSAKLDQATIALGTGIKGPIPNFGTGWQIPLGISASYAQGPVTFGAAFTFGALISGADNPPPPMPPVEGTDLRVVQLWVSYSTAAAPARAAR